MFSCRAVQQRRYREDGQQLWKVQGWSQQAEQDLFQERPRVLLLQKADLRQLWRGHEVGKGGMPWAKGGESIGAEPTIDEVDQVNLNYIKNNM